MKILNNWLGLGLVSFGYLGFFYDVVVMYGTMYRLNLFWWGLGILSWLIGVYLIVKNPEVVKDEM